MAFSPFHYRNLILFITKTAGFSEKAAQSNALPPENRLMLYRQYARKSYRAKSIGNPLHIFIIHLMHLVFHITGVNYL